MNYRKKKEGHQREKELDQSRICLKDNNFKSEINKEKGSNLNYGNVNHIVQKIIWWTHVVQRFKDKNTAKWTIYAMLLNYQARLIAYAYL